MGFNVQGPRGAVGVFGGFEPWFWVEGFAAAHCGEEFGAGPAGEVPAVVVGFVAADCEGAVYAGGATEEAATGELYCAVVGGGLGGGFWGEGVSGGLLCVELLQRLSRSSQHR